MTNFCSWLTRSREKVVKRAHLKLKRLWERVNSRGSIYRISNMTARLSTQNCNFFFKILLSGCSHKRLDTKKNMAKYGSLAESLGTVLELIYRMWAFGKAARKGWVSGLTVQWIKIHFVIRKRNEIKWTEIEDLQLRVKRPVLPVVC